MIQQTLWYLGSFYVMHLFMLMDLIAYMAQVYILLRMFLSTYETFL